MIKNNIKTMALCGTLAMIGATAQAGISFSSGGTLTNWNGVPTYVALANGNGLASATVAQTDPTISGSFGVMSEVFTPTSSFQLVSFNMLCSITVAGTYQVHLYDLGPAGSVSVSGSTSYTPGTDLFSGLSITLSSTGGAVQGTFALSGADQVTLSANRQYALEIWTPSATGSSGFSWYRNGGSPTDPGGQMFTSSNSTNARLTLNQNGQAGGTPRIAALALYAVPGTTSNPPPSLVPGYDIGAAPKMAWWYDARFGMLIHFGSYSYYGQGEWAFFDGNWTKANYQTQISAHFNPTNFNAATIVSYAKAAGMKYIVITAKHHEGFAMWHSQVPGFTDATGTNLYNLYDYAGFHRDLLMELKNACDAQGIKFCLYYSIMDWDHPSQTVDHSTYYTDMASFTARSNYISDMKAQLTELITNYDPAVLWFDGDWCGNPNPPTLIDWWTEPDGTNLYNFLIQLKPDLIVNERVKRGFELGDFDVEEQTIPAAPLSRFWETAATMNGAWGYNTNNENSYRSPTTILHEMVQVLSRDGNYLLNIGPEGDGTMTPGSTNILGALATWMNVYSESVHGTTRSPYGTNEPSWGYYTKTPGKLYAHVFNWPIGGLLQVPVLSNTVTRVYLLNDTNDSLNYTINGGNINISVPTTAPNAMDSVVVVAVSPPPISVDQLSSPNQVTLSWPIWGYGSAVTGYSLYSTTNLAAAQWQLVTNTVQADGNTFGVNVQVDDQGRFFMLAPP